MHAFQLSGDNMHYSVGPWIVHETHKYFIKKNIRNESHSTIYTFKNYVVIVFLVFSKISDIQTNPKSEF